MRVVITCGPSYEPIDQVRRITNFSTGELGLLLAERCATAGVEVFCLMGEAATCPLRPRGVEPISFSTNENLLVRLEAIRAPGEIDYVFHAAALADFKVESVTDADGRSFAGGKIESRSGALTLRLVPAIKLIGRLRALFPRAWIAGWKYELDGSREEALAKGFRQIAENQTDACFVNGAAYGEGFGHVEHDGLVAHYASKEILCEALIPYLSNAW
ncbi:MAG: coaBC 2 [Chthoniobacteraceae bacterium]|nr:coaBC 2 [Chthoniobacteraceae bacterium]